LANLTVSTTANAAVQSVAIADVTTAWQANATAQLSQIEGANAAIVTANTALKGYVDAQDTAISNSVTGANAAIVTANTAMKGYVDAVTTAWEANAGTQLTSINNITNGTSTFGNLVPSANVTYSLGSETAQWKDLYLSGSTIYIGGATLSVANGAIESSLPISANLTATNITVQGTRIAFASGGYIEESEVLDGNLEPTGIYGVSLNSSDDGIIGMNALDSNAAVTSSVFATNVSVQLNVASSVIGDPAHIWYFDNTGAVTFPDITIQTTAWTGFVDAANVTSLSTVATSGDYNDLVANVPVLSNVAITGEYSDIANVPNLDAISDFLTGTPLAPTQGGTGLASPGTEGNILTSNGAAWISTAAPISYAGFSTVIFGSSGTWTVPAGITQARISVIGGGGGANYIGSQPSTGRAGGDGGAAIAYCTGLSGTLTITIGAGGAGSDSSGYVALPGGNSSVTGTGVSILCTGGAAGFYNGSIGVSGTGTVTTGTALKTSISRADGVTYQALNYIVTPQSSAGSTSPTAVNWTVTSETSAGRGGDAANNQQGACSGAVVIEY
jgi:hypothetical protein